MTDVESLGRLDQVEGLSSRSPEKVRLAARLPLRATLASVKGSMDRSRVLDMVHVIDEFCDEAAANDWKAPKG